MSKPINPLRPLLFDCMMYPVTIVLAVCALPILVSRRATGWLASAYVQGVMLMVRYILGIRCDFVPNQAIANGRGRILAVKHQSAWETLALRAYFPNAVGVAKQVLFWAPFGWYMYRLGYIPIDRTRGSKALRTMIKQVNDRLNQGMDVVVYPEGTRRDVGAEAAYKTGIYGLYQYCQAEVIPVAHNSGETWGKRPLFRRPGEVKMLEMPSLPQGLDKAEFMALLEDRIESGCKSLTALV